MKKIIFVLCILLFSCSASKNITADQLVKKEQSKSRDKEKLKFFTGFLLCSYIILNATMFASWKQ